MFNFHWGRSLGNFCADFSIYGTLFSTDTKQYANDSEEVLLKKCVLSPSLKLISTYIVNARLVIWSDSKLDESKEDCTRKFYYYGTLN